MVVSVGVVNGHAGVMSVVDGWFLAAPVGLAFDEEFVGGETSLPFAPGRALTEASLVASAPPASSSRHCSSLRRATRTWPAAWRAAHLGGKGFGRIQELHQRQPGRSGGGEIRWPSGAMAAGITSP